MPSFAELFRFSQINPRHPGLRGNVPGASAGVLRFDSFNIFFPVKIFRQSIFDRGLCHFHPGPVSRADDNMGRHRRRQKDEENRQQQADAEIPFLRYKENQCSEQDDDNADGGAFGQGMGPAVHIGKTDQADGAQKADKGSGKNEQYGQKFTQSHVQL